MKYNSVKEWQDEAKRRFGDDPMSWKFRCPMCGHVASVRDFKDAGAKSSSCAYQECIGRYTGKGSPKKGNDSGCDWCIYGLFGTEDHDKVVADNGKEIDVYPFAEVSQK